VCFYVSVPLSLIKEAVSGIFGTTRPYKLAYLLAKFLNPLLTARPLLKERNETSVRLYGQGVGEPVADAY
jgi:hypothetical protein